MVRLSYCICKGGHVWLLKGTGKGTKTNRLFIYLLFFRDGAWTDKGFSVCTVTNVVPLRDEVVCFWSVCQIFPNDAPFLDQARLRASIFLILDFMNWELQFEKAQSLF